MIQQNLLLIVNGITVNNSNTIFSPFTTPIIAGVYN